ncbi:hypothetical protein [Methanopyrus sp.]
MVGVIPLKVLALLVLAWLAYAFLGFVKFYVTTGCMPLGRLAFVKLHDPDIRPGGLHEIVATNVAHTFGYPAVTIVHNAGSESMYGSWTDRNGVLVWNIAALDPRGNRASVDWYGALRELVFADRLRTATWVHDGPIGGPRFPKNSVIFWHGTVRNGFPLLYGGCGCEPYYYILANYGNIPFAITATVLGWFTPFLISPLEAFWELSHYKRLQYEYLKKVNGIRLINLKNYEGASAAPTGSISGSSAPRP